MQNISFWSAMLQDESVMILQNTKKCSPNNTGQHPRRLEISAALMWDINDASVKWKLTTNVQRFAQSFNHYHFYRIFSLYAHKLMKPDMLIMKHVSVIRCKQKVAGLAMWITNQIYCSCALLGTTEFIQCESVSCVWVCTITVLSVYVVCVCVLWLL
jgi:hypothetical protein